MPHRRRVRQSTLRLRAAATRSRRADRRLRWLLLYLRQEGRGIGLYAKLEAYALQDMGLDTYEANLALGHREDERSYVAAAQMLHALGVSKVALLSNNPDKARQLRRCGVSVAAQVPTGVHLSPANGRYLAAKARRARTRSTSGCRRRCTRRPATEADVGLPAAGCVPNALRKRSRKASIGQTGAWGSAAGRPPSPTPRSGPAPPDRGR